MDPEKKAAALQSATEAVDNAKTSLSNAKAELQKAQEAKDEAAITKAQGDVTSAESALATAQAKVTELQGSAADDADELIGDTLADGTDPKKKIQLPFDKFKDLNEKSQLFDQFAPLLSKLQQDPALVERLMAGDDPTKSIADRLTALEQRETAAKKAEVKDTITKALTIWPDFKEKWGDIKPLVAGMQAQGISYADAVQRAYFAINPDAVKKQERLVQVEAARQRENARGQGSMGGGAGGPIVHEGGDDDYQMTDADREFAQKTGINPELYKKHADWIARFKDL